MKNWICKIMFVLILLVGVFCVYENSLVVDSTNTNRVLLAQEGEGGGETTEPGQTETEKELIKSIDTDIKVGYVIQSTTITDTRLYSALLNVIKKFVLDKYNYNYSTLDTLYSKMFVDIESIEIVDYDISSLKGLDLIYFNNLKTLKIVGNSFGDLTTDEYKGLFERMSKLETLDLSNNNISAISLKNATNVKNLNLSSNNLSQIDLSYLKSADLDINIANNNFSSIKQIGLPTKTDLINSIKLNIIMNNITDLSEEFVNYSKLTLDIGLQGIVGKSQQVVLTTSDTLTFYKLNKGGVYAKIYKSTARRDTLVRTIKDDVDYTDSDKVTINLPVGEYYVEYYLGDNAIDYQNDRTYGYFQKYYFQVIPNVCDIKYEYKGKIYDNFTRKVTGKVKVLLSCEEGGEIYYKIGNGEWIQGNEIMCDRGGDYSITTKVVIDNISSEEKSILIKTSLNLIIPDILMLILILLFALTLFLVVVPLVSKKWFRKS